MTEPTYRRQMLAHCLKFARAGDPAYARWAAAWYEKNQPDELHGLADRVSTDISRMQAKEAASGKARGQG